MAPPTRKQRRQTARSLEGRTAFLSGSYRGIGYSLARALGEAGAQVVLNGRSAARVARSVAVLSDQGITASGYAFDVTVPAEVTRQMKRIREATGGIDILVNNAGMHCRQPLEKLSVRGWRQVLDLNLTAAFLLGRACIRDMRQRGGGKIINMASLMSYITRPTTAAYSAAKGGLLMLTKSMAVEWARYNVQANAIAPGYIRTEMTEHLLQDEAFNAWIVGRTPAGRWGLPEDLAGLAVFLAGPDSNFLTGQCLVVDGGLSATI